MSAWPMPEMDDPFRREEWAETVDEAFARPGKDAAYHADQGRNIKRLAARSIADRIHAEAGDLADTIAALDLEGHAEYVADRIKATRRTLALAELNLRNTAPAREDDSRHE